MYVSLYCFYAGFSDPLGKILDSIMLYYYNYPLALLVRRSQTGYVTAAIIVAVDVNEIIISRQVSPHPTALAFPATTEFRIVPTYNSEGSALHRSPIPAVQAVH